MGLSKSSCFTKKLVFSPLCYHPYRRGRCDGQGRRQTSFNTHRPINQPLAQEMAKSNDVSAEREGVDIRAGDCVGSISA